MARTEGSKNRNTQYLTNRLKAMMGEDFEPMINSAKCAVRMQVLADESEGTDEEFNMQKECANTWEKIGQYCSPKLKAIEVTGEDGGPVITRIERIIVQAKD